MGDEEYGEYLEGKRVVLVAHGSYLVGSENGSLIDSYDVVARLNDSIPIPEELKPDIGTRCDILYSSMSPYFRLTSEKDTKSVSDLGIKVICRPIPLQMDWMPRFRIGKFDLTLWKDKLVEILQDVDVCVRVSGKEPWHKRTKEVRNGRLPLTGMTALWDLLEFGVAEVFMIGFNFFQEGTYSQYPQFPKTEEELEKWNESTGLYRGRHHILYPQMVHLETLSRRDKRIKFDEHLARIILSKVKSRVGFLQGDSKCL
jgi:hypothetical protein